MILLPFSYLSLIQLKLAVMLAQKKGIECRIIECCRNIERYSNIREDLFTYGKSVNELSKIIR